MLKQWNGYMQRNFSADIHIKTSNSTKNIVSIIPFSDSDKNIARTLEKVLNHSLMYENELGMDLDRDFSFLRLTNELR